MSLLKRLFGGGGNGADGGNEAAEEVEHEGYLIQPAPIKEGGQFRLSAVISKEVDGERKEHRLIRADVFSSADEAAKAAVRKAEIVIKEQGDRMFD